MTGSRATVTVVLAILAIPLPGALSAQPSKGPPNALQGFSENRDQPVNIEAATLEVRDKQKEATFSGNVRVQQGDTALRCKSLVVFYEGGPGSKEGGPEPKTAPAPTMTAAKPGPGGEQKIKRLEARGGVVVTKKEQTVTGELGIFDMQSNTVTVTGNVTMTQGKNVLRGDRLVVDLTNGISRVESGKNGSGRVQGLFEGSGSSELKSGGIGQKTPSAPAMPALPVPLH